MDTATKTRRACNTVKAQQDQLQRQLQQAQAQQAAQEQAAADARRDQQNRALIEAGMRLMNPPRPPLRPPIICNTFGNTTTCR